MLASAEIVNLVAGKIRDHELTYIVVDPVMVATSGDRLLQESAIDALKMSLIPLATVVTPNIDEASP
jgi:hydroxymethylpyrimidine/phosphomethylpyrimidine kinase